MYEGKWTGIKYSRCASGRSIFITIPHTSEGSPQILKKKRQLLSFAHGAKFDFQCDHFLGLIYSNWRKFSWWISSCQLISQPAADYFFLLHWTNEHPKKRRVAMEQLKVTWVALIYTNKIAILCVCEYVWLFIGVRAIFSRLLLSHPHSGAPWGSLWQCKPDLAPSVSSGMNNSQCSGWRAPANGRHGLEWMLGCPWCFSPSCHK